MLGFEESGYRDLARALRQWAASQAPDWTDANDSDPGLTLLELFAFVTESLAARGGTFPERARLSAARLARAALALADENAEVHGTLVRNRYFSGRLLGADDFQVEQDYVRERLRRHNRALHGAGIVSGLQVSVQQDGGGQHVVVVQPGFAIAPDGEEIEVACEARASLPESGSQLSVLLTHTEQFTHPVPVSDDEPVQFTRIAETFSLHLAATAGGKAVTLARLIRATDGWKIDQTLPAPRIACHRD